MSLTLSVVWGVLLALVVLAVWLLYRRPPAVEVTRVLSAERVFVGTPFSIRFAVRARSPLPVRIQVEDHPPRAVVGDTVSAAGAFFVGEFAQELDIPMRANRRGEYTWAGVQLRYADPFGLFWRTVELDLPQTLTVLPSTHGLKLPELLRPMLSEGEMTRTLGLEDPMSLRGVRGYVPGDPPRRIHWKASGRTGALMVRELEHTAASKLVIAIDARGNADYLESATRLAASLLREADELHLPTLLGLPARRGEAPRTVPASGPEGRMLALGALSRLRLTEEAPVLPTVPSGSNFVVITMEGGRELMDELMRARVSAARVAVIALPEGFYLEPGETGRRMHAAPPDTVRLLERQAGVLAENGVRLYLVRGNQSVLRLAG